MKFYPATPKFFLYLLAGIMWSAVGIMLVSIGTGWLKDHTLLKTVSVISAGIIAAFFIYFFGFSRFAKSNIRRINAFQKDKVCIFAFQKWSSYPLVIFMISLGIYLRVYSSIPKDLLAILYFGIGGGLFLSSGFYYAKVFLKTKRMA